MGWVCRGDIRDEAQLHYPNIKKAELVEATTLTYHINLLMPTSSIISQDIKFDAKSLRHSIETAVEDEESSNKRHASE